MVYKLDLITKIVEYILYPWQFFCEELTTNNLHEYDYLHETVQLSLQCLP